MEKKHVTHMARNVLELWNIGVFPGAWMGCYNAFVFDTYWKLGGRITVFLFFTVYNMLCNLYKAFRIASSSMGDTIFSQVVSFGIADLLFYVECCLVWNRYVSIVPGLAAAAAQISGTALLVVCSKRYMMEHITPKGTLLIYGAETAKEEAEAFSGRILTKYAHLFDIRLTESEQKPWEELKADVDRYDTILLYELSNGKRSDLVTYCMQKQKVLYFTPRIFDIMLQGCSPRHLLDTPLMKYDYTYERYNEDRKKRIMDLLLSFTGLILLSPVLLATALAIKLEDNGPVFFKQKRCTKDARVFEILKFRSMVVDAEKYGVIPCGVKDPRITRVGRLIRATRIDELPQLINILRGEMSFVGPRPERVEHVEQYMKDVPEFAYRMRVKGGLTGYAQIFGKYNTSAYDKLRLDLMYIENQSFLLDLKLIMLTFRTVFQPESTEGFAEEKVRKINQKSKQRKTVSVEAAVQDRKVLEQIAK